MDDNKTGFVRDTAELSHARANNIKQLQTGQFGEDNKKSHSQLNKLQTDGGFETKQELKRLSDQQPDIFHRNAWSADSQDEAKNQTSKNDSTPAQLRHQQQSLVANSGGAAHLQRTTSTTEGPKFRKKGISEYLSGFDNSGNASGSNQNIEQLSSNGQNVQVAPRGGDMIIEFYPKNSVVSEKLNNQQRIMTSQISSPTDTPKTAGLRKVQPFQLKVPDVQKSTDQVADFNPSVGSEKNVKGNDHALRIGSNLDNRDHSDQINQIDQQQLNQASISKNHNNDLSYGGESLQIKEVDDDGDRMKELDHLEQQKIEKNNYKLADYFVTIGIDNYYTADEVYRLDEQKKDMGFEMGQTQSIEKEMQSVKIDNQKSSMRQEIKNQIEDFKIIEDEDSGLLWQKIVKSLEIFVIRDQLIFEKGMIVNGAKTTFVHPKNINEENEKWIDLRGDQVIYLKVTYDDVKNVKRPISDLNFYKISKFSGQTSSQSTQSSSNYQKTNKMQIHVSQAIEPIPVKVFGDPDAEKKIHKTKKLGKNGNKKDDMYNFYGDYDLTSYFEDEQPQELDENRKNLCLCVSTKKAAPVQDLILVIGEQIPNAQSRTHDGQIASGMTITWDVPEGYKKLAYSVGTNGVLNRLLCLKTRDITKQKLKPKVLDRYPPEGQDRHYYPFPPTIGDFCFPSGINLKFQPGSPEFFNFNLTDANGLYIYGSCLIFDEEPSRAFLEKLKTYHVRNISQVRAIKAICILSHYSFNNAFKDILCQLYRMHLSTSRLNLPLERYIINIIDEIPLPDEGKLLVQHELKDKTASFYRPVDQNPPIIDETDVENLFKCLSVENIIEIFSYLLLERKVLIISEHKALMTQVINCLNSFLFPFQWKHTMIPILPNSMTDILEAPFPYLIGIEPTSKLEQLDIEHEVLCVYLEKNQLTLPDDIVQQSQMPQLPFKEYRQLKQRLMKASEHIMRVPDEQMLLTVDLAFNNMFVDPEENDCINHLEVRDAFLEFLTSIMSGYTKYLKDLSEHYETITNITNAKECFDMTSFRMQKDAKKPYTFIYKFTETTHFAYFIECRALGQTEHDQQIIFFEKILQLKRNLMNPRLLFPFVEQKSIKSMQPNEEGLNGDDTWGYKVWPTLDNKWFIEARSVPDYNKDSIYQQIMGCLIRPEELTKMHDDEFARYMLEVLFLLWFQVFCTTLPIYSSYAPQLIEFARRLLIHTKSKIKPMRDVEFIYRRLFESCGTCKQSKELIEINKEMKKSKIQPDKVTSGTFYQAMLECKRRGGAKEDETDKRRSYFGRRIEDYQDKLSHNCGDDDYMDPKNQKFRFSNVSLGQKGPISDQPNQMQASQTATKHNRLLSPQASDVFDDKDGVIDFQDLLGNQQNQHIDQKLTSNDRGSNPQRLSAILETYIFIEIEKSCSKCKELLREEELFSGFQKSLSNYTVKCPICKSQFVPKFTIYCEKENSFLKGRQGTTVSLLPPITLYKEFFNILMKEGDQILMSENFIQNHKIAFWNMILYFKILKLPSFMLDLDYSPQHQRAHCSQIKKYLPIEKKMANLFGRNNSNSRQQNLLPPSLKLDSSNLKKLNEIENSPQRIGQYAPTQANLVNFNKSENKKGSSVSRPSGSFVESVDGGGSKSSNLKIAVPSSSQRPSSIKRMANNVMGMFNAEKVKGQHYDQNNLNVGMDNITDSISNIPGSEFQAANFGNNINNLPPTKDGIRKQNTLLGSNQTQQQAIRNQIVQQQQMQVQASTTTMDSDKKGIHGVMGNFLSNIKKTSSQKSGGNKPGSRKSGGGPGSIGTSISDLEKIEKLMNEAQHAKKSVVKYFGSYFEEFRREMHYNKEIVLSDQFLLS